MKKWYKGLTLNVLRERLPSLERAASKTEQDMAAHNAARSENEKQRMRLAMEYFAVLKARTLARKELEAVKDAIRTQEAAATPEQGEETLDQIVAKRKAAYKGEAPNAAPVIASTMPEDGGKW